MELFSFLEKLTDKGWLAEFVPRVPGVETRYDKEEMLAALEPFHRQKVEEMGCRWESLWRAEQIHGIEVEEVPASKASSRTISGVDGLMTNDEEALLGIYVADCGLLWVVDEGTGARALLHSGRKGSEGGILLQAIRKMEAQYGTKAEDLTVILGPCIRPPNYEVDIVAMMSQQAKEAGVGEFVDCGLCTGSDLERFYSYRLEKGKTGRMLGLLGGRRGKV